MLSLDTPIKCKEYEPMNTEDLLFWMGNSYVFFYSCENCINCGKCKKSLKNNK